MVSITDNVLSEYEKQALRSGVAEYQRFVSIASCIRHGFGGKERKGIHSHVYWFGKKCKELGFDEEFARELYEIANQQTPRKSVGALKSFLNGYQALYGKKPKAESLLSYGFSRYFNECEMVTVQRYSRLGTLGDKFSIQHHNEYGLPAEVAQHKEKLPLLLFTRGGARVSTDINSTFQPANIVVDFDDLNPVQYRQLEYEATKLPFKTYWQNSFSWTAEKPKGHLIIPLANNGVEVSKVEWSDLVTRIIEKYFHAFGADKTSKDTQTFISKHPIIASNVEDLLEVYYAE